MLTSLQHPQLSLNGRVDGCMQTLMMAVQTRLARLQPSCHMSDAMGSCLHHTSKKPLADAPRACTTRSGMRSRSKLASFSTNGNLQRTATSCPIPFHARCDRVCSDHSTVCRVDRQQKQYLPEESVHAHPQSCWICCSRQACLCWL